MVKPLTPPKIAGRLIRLEHGTTWQGYPIAQAVETGEIPASGNIWEICQLVMLKLIYQPIAENVTLTVTIFYDGAVTGETLATLSLQGFARLLRFNKNLSSKHFWTYRLRFSAETSATPRGMQLLTWSAKYKIERKDDQ